MHYLGGSINLLGNDALLRYGGAFIKAYERFLKGLENGDFVYTNEEEMRCYLFSEYIKYLQENDFPRPYHIFVDYKVDGRKIDLVIQIVEEKVEKVIAIEVKLDPALSGIEEDLIKLREMIEKGLAIRGIFITLAFSDYQLKKRLKEEGVFSKFGLNADGKGDRGFVQWRTIKTPYTSKSIDALYIILWK